MISRPRWSGVELPDPSAPAEDLPPWGPVRLLTAVRARWRWWMVGPLVLAVVAAAAVVPNDATVERPVDLVDARSLVQVLDDRDRPGPTPGHTGTYLVTDTRITGRALDWVVALVAPGRATGPAPTERIDMGIHHLDVALLAGIGVAPGRGDPASLGVAATMTAPDVPQELLGVLLHVADSVAGLDLSGGRRVLALGSVQPDGTIRCSADPAGSMTAAVDAVDLVLVGAGCADDVTPAVPVVEVMTLAGALVALTGPMD